jgi:hypothetical protein
VGVEGAGTEALTVEVGTEALGRAAAVEKTTHRDLLAFPLDSSRT